MNNHNFKKGDIVRSKENTIVTYKIIKLNLESANIQVITKEFANTIYNGVQYELLEKVTNKFS